MRGSARFAALLSLGAFAAGCTSVSTNYVGEITKVSPDRLIACHGFNCYNKTRVPVTSADEARFEAIFAGVASPADERAAVSGAVQHFENMTTAAVGAPDNAKSVLAESGGLGQMDCIDESTNTRSLLRHLKMRGLIVHHEVETNVSRGVFADGRYPHSTAVLRDATGVRWAIDSWYEPAGGAPDIMPLDIWVKRGVLGER